MKIFLILILFFSALTANALVIEIRGKKQAVLFNQEVSFALPKSLGEISVKTFEKEKIHFEGSPAGLSSLKGISNDMEIISDQEMKAYGWCFSVDGAVPDTLSSDTMIENDSAKIVWFYAFAHYKNGQWIKQCSPDL